MLPITPYTLIALALASCVAASTGSAPSGFSIPQPPPLPLPRPRAAVNHVTVKGNPIERKGGLDVPSNVLIYLNIRKMTTQQLKKIIRRAAIDCVARNFNEVRDELAVKLIHVRNQFIETHANLGMKPVHLPSCFKIAPNQLEYCSSLLFSVIEHKPTAIKDWIKISPLDFVKEIIKANGKREIHDPHWYLKFAEIHAGHLLGTLNVDDGWTRFYLFWLVEMLAHIETHFKTDGQYVRHALSASLCGIVSKVSFWDDNIAGGRITGGVNTLYAVLISLFNDLADEKAVKSSRFLELGILHHDPNSPYDPRKSIGSSQPSLYDIVQGLVRVIDPQLSSADKKMFGKRIIQDIPHIFDESADISQEQLVFAAINCALRGLRPPQDWLQLSEPGRTLMVNEWLKWQFSTFSLKYSAVNGKAK